MFTPTSRMLVSTALLLICATARAAAPAPPPAEQPLPAYDTLDADRDGIVTLPEIVVHAPHLAERLKACDRDGDQKLTREEYARCGQTTAAHAPTH